MSSEAIFGSRRFASCVEKPNLALVRAGKKGCQRLFVQIQADTAYCPRNGPYLHYAYQGEVDHRRFFSSLLSVLEAKEVKYLYLRIFPSFYFDWIEDTQNPLKQNLNSTETIDTNYHLPLNDSFITILPPDQKRVLRLAEDAGYRCSFSCDWEAIRGLVSRSRLKKGFGDAVSLKLLQELVTSFPNHYQGIECRIGTELAGAGVLIRVDDRIAYLFYVANHSAHLRYSPSLQIIRFCADWARGQGFQYLDLGTASKDGVANEGVRAFKESLGGVVSHKSSFCIRL